MIVAVVGNCQAKELTKCLRRHYPELDIRGYFVGSDEDNERFRSEVTSLDILVTQWIGGGSRFLHTDEAVKHVRSVIKMPNFSFTGFHPDITYLNSSGALFYSPVGAYHSRIISSSYLLDLPADRVPALFNKYIYARLGYTDEYRKAEARFNAEFAKHGFSLSTVDFGQNVFMHTINHAAGIAISHLAKEIAQKISLPTDGWAYEQDVEQDGLLPDTIWPVYPELAQSIGVEGSLQFKPFHRMMKVPGEVLDVQTFVDRSYEIYARRPIDRQPLENTIAVLRKELSSAYA